MKKVFLFLILFLLPFTVSAKTVDIYLFYGAECAYCHQEREFLNILQKQYFGNINIYEYEVWHDEDNNELLEKVRAELNDKGEGVPFLVIGSESITGYMSGTSTEIQNLVNQNLIENETNIVNNVLNDEKIVTTDNEELVLPFAGNVNVKETPLFVSTLLLAIADAISVNGLFIILFLTSLLLVINKYKKLFIIPFLLALALIYGLLIFGVFSFGSTLLTIIRTIIALIPIIIAAFILGKFIKTIEKKKTNKIEDFIKKHKRAFLGISAVILGSIMGLLFYNAAAGYPNILGLALEINDQNTILYYIFYIIIFIIIIYLIVILLNKLLNKIIPNKYICSFIILMLIGVVLIFLPNLFMFTS